MIELYFWTTPNGYKPLLFLEETGVDYEIHPINISTGEQFSADFLKISPNNRIPAITDHNPVGGGRPISLFESGAILQYLAEKHGAFLPADPYDKAEVLQWLHWQMGGLGPMLGQYLHFVDYASEPVPYAVNRYTAEAKRLLGVLDQRLDNRDYLVDNYSIADMAIYPWIKRVSDRFTDYENIGRWLDAISSRPATISAYEKGAVINTVPTITEDSKALLFGSARTA